MCKEDVSGMMVDGMTGGGLKESKIERALLDIKNAIGNINEITIRLSGKLIPVLSPIKNNNIENDKKDTCKENVPLLDELHSIHETL